MRPIQTPLEGALAVARAIFTAVFYEAGWLAAAYVLIAILSFVCLAAINHFEATQCDKSLSPQVLKLVLEKVQDQAARFVVTSNVSLFVFTVSLALRNTGINNNTLMWMRSFPSLGFALIQVYSMTRWYEFFKNEVEV